MREDGIKITAFNPKDKKVAKVLEELINKDYHLYKPFIDSITSARTGIETITGWKSPDVYWNRILEEGMKLAIDNYKKSSPVNQPE